ncbi:MAG: hypothetical protein ACR2KG_06435 [Nocardioidaceae bacterium]
MTFATVAFLVALVVIVVLAVSILRLRLSLERLKTQLNEVDRRLASVESQPDSRAPHPVEAPVPVITALDHEAPDADVVPTARVLSVTSAATPLIKLAALGYGLRRALDEEQRMRLGYAFRKELRRQQKLRRRRTLRPHTRAEGWKP